MSVGVRAASSTTLHHQKSYTPGINQAAFSGSHQKWGQTFRMWTAGRIQCSLLVSQLCLANPAGAPPRLCLVNRSKMPRLFCQVSLCHPLRQHKLNNMLFPWEVQLNPGRGKCVGSDLSYRPPVPDVLAIAGILGFPPASSVQHKTTRNGEGADSSGDNFQ